MTLQARGPRSEHPHLGVCHPPAGSREQEGSSLFLLDASHQWVVCPEGPCPSPSRPAEELGSPFPCLWIRRGRATPKPASPLTRAAFCLVLFSLPVCFCTSISVCQAPARRLPLASIHRLHPSHCADIYISKAQRVFMFPPPPAKQGFSSQIYSQLDHGEGRVDTLLIGVTPPEAVYSSETKRALAGMDSRQTSTCLGPPVPLGDS